MPAKKTTTTSGKKSPKKTTKKATKKSFEEQQKERIDISKKFAKKVVDKYGDIIKSVVLWGSTVRGEFKEKSDIDFVVLIDDTKKPIPPHVREEMDHGIYDIAKKMNELISPQPCWTITEFVSMTRTFNSLAYAVLKSSMPIYDTGFFSTHKRLLDMGMITATPESSYRRWGDVPRRLERAKQQKLYIIIEDLYYAMIGAEEAVMMYMGKHLPHPIHASKELREELVKPGYMDEKHLKTLDEVIKLRKKVEEREIKDIESKEIDGYIKKTEEFVAACEGILRELEIMRKKTDVQRAYEAMVRASVSALKALDKLPKEPKKLPEAFKKHLVDSHRVSPYYYEVLDHVLFMKHKMNEKKVEEVTERELTLTTEYVRRFVGEVGRIHTELGIKPEEISDVPDVDVKPKRSTKKKSDQKKSEKRMDLDTVKKREEEEKLKEHKTA